MYSKSYSGLQTSATSVRSLQQNQSDLVKTSLHPSLVPTGAGADVLGARAIVAPGTGGQTGAPLAHPVQLQVEEEARFTGQATVEGRACRTTCRARSARREATCGYRDTRCVCVSVCLPLLQPAV